ncbi:MAG: SRPBCC family protein [Armatimonadota bacterium]|nr:SRPBCC family protein [Armatimonadota bacterium]
MAIIRTETFIAAQPEVCFDLARDVNAHASSTAQSKERIIDAPASGMLELGDEVEFEAVHFGIKQKLRSKIVEYNRPHRFVDEMQKGAFRRLSHVHEFEAVESGTRMIDVMDFASPLGFLGAIADRLFVASYLRRFVFQRNKELKAMAEARP